MAEVDEDRLPAHGTEADDAGSEFSGASEDDIEDSLAKQEQENGVAEAGELDELADEADM